jgi:gas vesicle protein
MFPFCFRLDKSLNIQRLLAALGPGECQNGPVRAAPRGTFLPGFGSPVQPGAARARIGETMMRTLTLAALACASALLAACNQSPAEKKADQTEEMGKSQADAIRADAEQRADSLENQADALDNRIVGQPPAADALESQAEAVRDKGERAADRLEDATEKSAEAQRDQQ